MARAKKSRAKPARVKAKAKAKKTRPKARPKKAAPKAKPKARVKAKAAPAKVVRANAPVAARKKPLCFQDMILTLQNFWAQYGCVILQPYDMEMGAGTFHPATTLRAL